MSSSQTDGSVGGWSTPGKRVAIVTEVWQPSVNGVVTRLVASIKRLQAAGHEVMVVAPAVDGVGPKGEKVPARVAGALAGVEMRWIPTFSVPFIYGGQPWGWPLPRVTQFLEEFQPDVVHVANPV
ncbi:MAG: glycosyltransferase, partial [Acidimicrobiales bacterium]